LISDFHKFFNSLFFFLKIKFVFRLLIFVNLNFIAFQKLRKFGQKKQKLLAGVTNVEEKYKNISKEALILLLFLLFSVVRV